jgi:DNA ligase-1
LREIFNIVDQLANTSSRTDKEGILKRNINNQLLKDVLKFIYDPFTITGLSKKKINKNTNLNLTIELNTIEEAMYYIKKNNTGRDIDIANLQHFIYRHDKDLQDFFKQVFTKELKIGVTATTLNKVYGKGFINDFSVMLAEPFERFYTDIACEVKVDGTRCLTIKQGNSVNMFTRNGKLIEGFDNIANQIKLLPIETIVLDGELIGKNYTDTMNKLFRKSSGKEANYMIFDMLNITEFQEGISSDDYWTRKQGLIELFKPLDNKIHENLICVEPFKIWDLKVL